MTTKEINISISKLNLYLSKSEKIEHWINFSLLILPLIFLGWVSIIASYQFVEFIFFGIFLAILLALILRHKIICTKLDAYNTDLTEEQFKQANKAAVILNDWILLSNRKNYFSAIKGTLWQWDGIRITAILKDGRLYINSMVNPSIHANPISFGLNRKTKNELIIQYQAILKNENVVDEAIIEVTKREDNFWKESEWSINNILFRLLGYGLSILFILVGYLFIHEAIWEGVALVLIPIVISWVYIRNDIKIIREKNRRRQMKK